MGTTVNLPEKFLYEIWKEQKFVTSLHNENEDKIEILDPGVENTDGDGPDFFNARIRIGNITYQGDVEIDPSYSDWKNHGHNLNKKYNRVILHSFLNSTSRIPFVITQEGRKVTSICLRDFIKNDTASAIQKAILNERKNRNIKMPCMDAINEVPDKIKLDYLFELGAERFQTKSKKILERLKEITYLKENHIKEPVIRYELDEKYLNKSFVVSDFSNPDLWYELIYEHIFEALGYSKNKDIMLKLARSIDIDVYKKLLEKENPLLYFEAVLYFVSGLLNKETIPEDEETSVYIKKLYECWNEVSGLYTGRHFKETQWKYGGLRPPNFPTVRLAGGARLLYKILANNLIGKIISEINVEQDCKKIIKSLRTMITVEAEGYWKGHYVFNQPTKEEIKFFVGLARADEIIINVILPVAAIYFQMFEKNNLFQKVMRVYASYYQNTENSLVMEVASTLDLKDSWKRSILYQGMIELFRSFCSHEKCGECVLGKKAFE